MISETCLKFVMYELVSAILCFKSFLDWSRSTQSPVLKLATTLSNTFSIKIVQKCQQNPSILCSYITKNNSKKPGGRTVYHKHGTEQCPSVVRQLPATFASYLCHHTESTSNPSVQIRTCSLYFNYPHRCILDQRQHWPSQPPSLAPIPPPEWDPLQSLHGNCGTARKELRNWQQYTCKVGVIHSCWSIARR